MTHGVIFCRRGASDIYVSRWKLKVWWSMLVNGQILCLTLRTWDHKICALSHADSLCRVFVIYTFRKEGNHCAVITCMKLFHF